jgi:hypothetical protein
MSITRGFIAVLTVLMGVTRFHYGDGHAFWPDASLAVFFLLGYLSSRPALLAGFLGLAGTIDVLAVTAGGISSYCFTPAYALLLPAYAAVWLAGRYGGCRQWSPLNPALAGLTLLGCSAAFLISEVGFYLYSGIVRSDVLSYAGSMLRYYPSYVLPGLAYVMILLCGETIGRYRSVVFAARNPVQP